MNSLRLLVFVAVAYMLLTASVCFGQGGGFSDAHFYNSDPSLPVVAEVDGWSSTDFVLPTLAKECQFKAYQLTFGGPALPGQPPTFHQHQFYQSWWEPVAGTSFPGILIFDKQVPFPALSVRLYWECTVKEEIPGVVYDKNDPSTYRTYTFRSREIVVL